MPKFVLSETTANKRRVYFTCRNTTDVNDRLQSSDMSGTFTCKLTKLGAASVTPCAGTPVPVQVDATNQKGVFYLELVAADLDTLGEHVLTISNSGGAKTMRTRDIKVIVTATDDQWSTAPANITQVATKPILAPATDGVLRVDVHGMETSVLTNAAIATDAFSVAKFQDGALALSKFAADAVLGLFGGLDTGTAQGGSINTITLQAGASATNGAYADAIVLIKSGTGALQVNQIDSYVGATKIATMKRSWTTAPNATSVYVVLAAGAAGAAPTAVAVAAAVWGAISEGSATYGDQIRGIFSGVLGKVRGFLSGTLVFKAMDGAKTRFTAVDDDDGRANVTYNDLTP
jgi:hypothetical protein